MTQIDHTSPLVMFSISLTPAQLALIRRGGTLRLKAPDVMDDNEPVTLVIIRKAKRPSRRKFGRHKRRGYCT